MELYKELRNIFSETEINEFRDICTSNNLKKIKKLFQKTGIDIFNNFDIKILRMQTYDYFNDNFVQCIYRYKYFKLIKYLYKINANLFAKYNIGLKYALQYGHLNITKWLLSYDIYNTKKSKKLKKIFYIYSIFHNHLHLIKYLLKLYSNIHIFANKRLIFSKIISFERKKHIRMLYFILQYKSQYLQLINKKYLSIHYKYYSINKRIIKWMF